MTQAVFIGSLHILVLDQMYRLLGDLRPDTYWRADHHQEQKALWLL